MASTSESKSELKIIASYLFILACWLLGADIQQILLWFADAEQYTKDIRALVMESADKDIGALAGGLVSAIYAISRTYKKTRGSLGTE